MSQHKPPGESCIPLNELADFISDQFVILEGENAINDLRNRSIVTDGMNSAYVAGKMAMLLSVSDFVEQKKGKD